MAIKGYTIQSISDEGTYYLVNGWEKHQAFWVRKEEITKAIFKTEGQAKASLTKLLKIMDDYKSDIFKMCYVDENNVVHYVII
jgi:hypothetical protein